MRKFSVSVLVAIVAMSAVLVIPQFQTTSAKEQTLEDHFQQLTRSTDWQQLEKIDLKFDVFHPQGMTKVGDLYYMSSVEIIEPTKKYVQPVDGYDRTPGKGVGHLFVFNHQGELLEDIKLGEGNMYHPGGIAYDDQYIWVPVAEYRPNSESIIYKVNTETLKAEEAFRVNDHIGGTVKDGKTGNIYGVSWGSRTFYEWNKNGKQLSVKENTSYFVDYQDCEDTGKGKMICSGIAELPTKDGGKYELGGVALLDLKNFETVHEVPVSKFSPQGHVTTRNPVFLEKSGEKMKLYAIPDDDDHASLLIYETTNLSN